MDSLIRDVPHDLTELLTVILGRSRLAMRWLPPEHPLCRDLDLIRRAAEGGVALARRMDSFGGRRDKPQAGPDAPALLPAEDRQGLLGQ